MLAHIRLAAFEICWKWVMRSLSKIANASPLWMTSTVPAGNLTPSKEKWVRLSSLMLSLYWRMSILLVHVLWSFHPVSILGVSPIGSVGSRRYADAPAPTPGFQGLTPCHMLSDQDLIFLFFLASMALVLHSALAWTTDWGCKFLVAADSPPSCASGSSTGRVGRSSIQNLTNLFPLGSTSVTANLASTFSINAVDRRDLTSTPAS